VRVYNSGGWVVEGMEPLPLHGGAVILVDEHLDVVSLRMYNEDMHPGRYRVSVEEVAGSEKAAGTVEMEATAGRAEGSLFYRKISSLVDPGRDPWRAFSETAALAVQEKIDHLCQRIRGL
jgi:hypothetical protein